MFAASAGSVSASIDMTEVLYRVIVDLENHYASEGDWQLEAIREVEIPSNADAVEVIDLPSTPTGTMLLRIRFLDKDEAISEESLAVRAHLWSEAWRAREPLTRGQPVNPYQLEAQRVDILREQGAVRTDATDDEEYIYARSVPAGRLVNWRDLSRRPVVQRGQFVEVAAVDGRISVTLKGIALEDAAIGELVRIRNPESRREIAALVTGSGKAEIRF